MMKCLETLSTSLDLCIRKYPASQEIRSPNRDNLCKHLDYGLR